MSDKSYKVFRYSILLASAENFLFIFNYMYYTKKNISFDILKYDTNDN